LTPRQPRQEKMIKRIEQLNKVADLYGKGIYRKAFFKGFDYAVEGKGWGFGEHSEAQDNRHIPKTANKKKYLKAWHHGCFIGAEIW